MGMEVRRAVAVWRLAMPTRKTNRAKVDGGAPPCGPGPDLGLDLTSDPSDAPAPVIVGSTNVRKPSASFATNPRQGRRQTTGIMGVATLTAGASVGMRMIVHALVTTRAGGLTADPCPQIAT